MKIWWGYRLAFDVTLLYAFANYFVMCKYYDKYAPYNDDSNITYLH